MASRGRRSASNIVSAAILEVFIMGLFVIIAQPQLRDALFGMLHPEALATPTHAAGAASSLGVLQNADRSGLHKLPPLRSDANTSETSSGVSTLSQLAGLAANALQGVANATAPNAGRAEGQPAYAPLEHYESFRVSVPENNVTSTNSSNQRRELPSTNQPNMPLQPTQAFASSALPYTSVMPPPVSATMPAFNYSTMPMTNANAIHNDVPSLTTPMFNYPSIYPTGYTSNGWTASGSQDWLSKPSAGMQRYETAPLGGNYTAQAPTQLVPGSWNIASAAQSPRPVGGWNVVRPAENDCRDPYPPPYGTQSQWK